MAGSDLKLAILSSHPIQYQAPLFRELAQRAGLTLRVFFCWDFGVKASFDRGFGRDIAWDVPLLDEYDSQFIPNASRDPGTHHFFGISNPTAAREILSWQPDAVLVHGYSHWTELDVIRRMYRKGVPVILRGESNLLHPRPWPIRVAKSVFLRRLMKKIAAAAAIGTLNAEFYRYFGLPAGRIFMAPYSVDNAYFQARAAEAESEAREWRSELGIAGRRTFLYAAKLIPVKGCADLIEAFGRQSDASNLALVIVGDGPLRPELEQHARRFNRLPIRFVGFVNQSGMPVAYRLGDVFVLPSHWEPWGLAVNEAMNAERPVIVSDQVGAAPDLVWGGNGWIFPAGDCDALSERVREAASSECLQSMGRASLERVSGWGLPETADGIKAAVEAAT